MYIYIYIYMYMMRLQRSRLKGAGSTYVCIVLAVLNRDENRGYSQSLLRTVKAGKMPN